MAFQTELVQVFLVVGNGVPENTGFCHKNDILKVEFDEFNIVGSSIYICNWVIFLDIPTNDFVLFIFFRYACFESNESEW